MGTQATEWPKQPNVLLILSDDLNTALSGFGHPDCKTPNLDRLAERGVRFGQMHCQFPFCGPSRASFMTGLYPVKSMVMDNKVNLRKANPDVLTMPQLFMQQGYHAVRVSKVYHMEIPKEIMSGKTRHDDPASWNQAFDIKSLELGSPGKNTNFSPKKKGSQQLRAIEAEGSDLSQVDGMAAEKAIEVMRARKDEPFFLAVGMVRPHVPFVAPKKYFDLYDPDAMHLPEVPADDLDDLPMKIRRNDSTAVYGVTTEGHKEILRAYYAAVSYMDAQVGRLMDELDALNLTDNTIVVFTSDHGFHLGEHHKWQKKHLFEETTRVPSIISVPWLRDAHGAQTEQFTELVDLYPTLAELAGFDIPSVLQGTSLVPLLMNPDDPQWAKDAVLTFSVYDGASLRTKDWRFTQWGEGAENMELYDLNKDPGEFSNQAMNPEYKTTVEKMKKRIADRIQEVR
ncbi:sulfatase [Pontiella agarivorans]|uniref:Sulfatase n=1 Tax=Pontiella agarivorans TaxID=3038953 RepID=A0ABU5N105_9BACT|nr:sulfatase [Pontiella agarivorans]MDZ8120031.1 sulfatase [Pontiella agarivorans]